MENKNKLFIISHTHWDREWYRTFQEFRTKLVFLIDELIDYMETAPEYKYFHMDGQTILIEDYLDIRPENKHRLEKLIQAGRIIIGPWYVMPDEFLVSGESLVRNLRKGHEDSKRYKVQPMNCGYVVDIFGHNSQLPQILKGFNIDSAMLYRGIGDYDKDLFNWIGVDGSNFLAIILDSDRSYSSFYFAIRRPFDGREYEEIEMTQRMNDYLSFARKFAVSDKMILMDGVDHIEIEKKLPEIINVLSKNIPDIEIVHSTLEQYIQAQKECLPNLDDIKGELYNIGKRGVNNQLLKNVLSSMVHLKQLNNECEIMLTKWAEPFSSFASNEVYSSTKGFIDKAWEYLLKNHPHDSICGCSISRVHKDNEYWFDQVMDIASEVLSIGIKDIVDKINTKVIEKDNAIVVFNPSQNDYHGVVEVDLEFSAGTQGNIRICENECNQIPFQILDVRKGVTKGEFEVRRIPNFIAKDYYKVAFFAHIPSMGYTTFGYEDLKNESPNYKDYTFIKYNDPDRCIGTMQVGAKTWDNGILNVTIEDNGTFKVINKKTGKEYKDILIFENCGDIGDGWNYRKPNMDSTYLSYTSKCDFSIEKDGPYIVQWKLVHNMSLPSKIVDNGLKRSDDIENFKIVTIIRLSKNSSRLDFKTYVDNNITDHRLRVLFPNYIKTNTFFSLTPYFMQERNVDKEDWSNHAEVETGVYPNQGVVYIRDNIDGMALYNKGLYEIEVKEDHSKSIALTLFRSYKNEVGKDIGNLSFMKRKMEFEYALEFFGSDISIGEVVVSGELWRSKIKSFCTKTQSGENPITKSYLKVCIPGAVLSAIKSGVNGMKIIRLYNCTNEKTKGHIQLNQMTGKVYNLNLNEEIIEENYFENSIIDLELNPAQIVTLGLV